MLFALHMIDKPASLELRQRLRPAHRAHLDLIADRLAIAGPLLDEGGAMAGSLIVAEFADRAAVEDWLANEPFTVAGLYARVDIRPFRNVYPQRAGFAEV
ncbi:YciI family protein [Methylibium petroleiphilum]|uniref:YciI family protein n=1 Tax=Methylibium petroleiphilum TaxID=105560 RepID=UPI003D2BF8C3